MKVYISGPMTGYTDYNKDDFEYAAVALRELGHEPISPFEMDQGMSEDELAGTAWETFLARDLKAVIDAEAVVALSGWETSKGACFEIDTARRLKKPVFILLWNGLTRYELVPLPEQETILEEAQRLVTGDRGADYGHPIEDFSRTAKIWSAILGVKVTASEVALCMVGLKLSREVNRPKRDNRVDAAGYLLTLEMVRERE